MSDKCSFLIRSINDYFYLIKSREEAIMIKNYLSLTSKYAVPCLELNGNVLSVLATSIEMLDFFSLFDIDYEESDEKEFEKRVYW